MMICPMRKPGLNAATVSSTIFEEERQRTMQSLVLSDFAQTAGLPSALGEQIFDGRTVAVGHDMNLMAAFQQIAHHAMPHQPSTDETNSHACLPPVPC